jgi:hypothetical protein
MLHVEIPVTAAGIASCLGGIVSTSTEKKRLGKVKGRKAGFIAALQLSI